MKHAIYPGSFDPITNGHIDIIERALKIFDFITIVVAVNPKKNYLFTVQERKNMICESLKYKGVREVLVVDFTGLTIDYAKKWKADGIIRGLRAVTDFESEFQTALVNRNLCPEVETVFLMTDKDYIFMSSTAVREISSFGGNVSNMVCPYVQEKLNEKFFPKEL